MTHTDQAQTSPNPTEFEFRIVDDYTIDEAVEKELNNFVAQFQDRFKENQAITQDEIDTIIQEFAKAGFKPFCALSIPTQTVIYNSYRDTFNEQHNKNHETLTRLREYFANAPRLISPYSQHQPLGRQVVFCSGNAVLTKIAEKSYDLIFQPLYQTLKITVARLVFFLSVLFFFNLTPYADYVLLGEPTTILGIDFPVHENPSTLSEIFFAGFLGLFLSSLLMCFLEFRKFHKNIRKENIIKVGIKRPDGTHTQLKTDNAGNLMPPTPPTDPSSVGMKHYAGIWADETFLNYQIQALASFISKQFVFQRQFLFFIYGVAKRTQKANYALTDSEMYRKFFDDSNPKVLEQQQLLFVRCRTFQVGQHLELQNCEIRLINRLFDGDFLNISFNQHDLLT